MNELEKLEAFKAKGWIYNPETGEIFSNTGKLINCTNKEGYIHCSTRINGETIRVQSHRLGFYLHYGIIPDMIDHINGIRNDNSITNLRSVTNQENQFNTKSKGYYWCKENKKYRAKIKFNKQIHLGYFDTEEEARQAYLDAKLIYHIIEH